MSHQIKVRPGPPIVAARRATTGAEFPTGRVNVPKLTHPVGSEVIAAASFGPGWISFPDGKKNNGNP